MSLYLSHTMSFGAYAGNAALNPAHVTFLFFSILYIISCPFFTVPIKKSSKNDENGLHK